MARLHNITVITLCGGTNKRYFNKNQLQLKVILS